MHEEFEAFRQRTQIRRRAEESVKSDYVIYGKKMNRFWNIHHKFFEPLLQSLHRN